jgi:hypothetical protein
MAPFATCDPVAVSLVARDGSHCHERTSALENHASPTADFDVLVPHRRTSYVRRGGS